MTESPRHLPSNGELCRLIRRRMYDLGWTQRQVAEALGEAESVVSKLLSENHWYRDWRWEEVVRLWSRMGPLW